MPINSILVLAAIGGRLTSLWLSSFGYSQCCAFLPILYCCIAGHVPKIRKLDVNIGSDIPTMVSATSQFILCAHDPALQADLALALTSVQPSQLAEDAKFSLSFSLSCCTSSSTSCSNRLQSADHSCRRDLEFTPTGFLLRCSSASTFNCSL